MSRLENPPAGLQVPAVISCRNLIRIGAIVASAIIAKTTSAPADDFRWDDFDRTETETEIETGTDIFIVF